MKKYLVSMLVAAMALSAIPAFCQGESGLNGKSEVMGAGAWIKASDVKLTAVGVSYGKFVNDKVEIQAMAAYGKVDNDGDTSKAIILAPAVAYHFITDKTAASVPYVGAGLAYAHVSSDGDSEDQIKPEFFAGMKFFLGGDYETANRSIFIEYRYTSIDMGDVDSDLNMIWGGLSCLF